MPQYFIHQENIKKDFIYITDSGDINHITNVLRYKKNDKLILVSTEGYTYDVEISEILQNSVQTKVLGKFISDKKLNMNITLAQSILKSAKQDFVIQKATELGVNEIIPFISKNTVVKINNEKDKTQKVQRWTKISYEASKQCQRYGLAEINRIISLSELIELKDFDIILACVEKDAQMSIKDFLIQNKPKIGSNVRILAIIGPEGGWDDKELELFKRKNIAPVSLGKLVLRAETAAITAISDIIYEYEL